MLINIKKVTALFVAVALMLLVPWQLQALAQESEPRLALVIGNADYRGGALATAANDAGLIADTLRAAGFEVSGAANLDSDSLRRAFRDFHAKAEQAGPEAIVFIYLSGRGIQYEGENYFAPIEAVIARDTGVPVEALRISDFTRSLAALPLKARIIVLDAARANDFAKSGPSLASGLALIDAEPGSLYAFNAAPGTIAPEEPPPYGAYAKALAEMLREGGMPIDEAFARARLRVNEATHGAFVPWDVSKIETPILLFAASPDAPPPVAAQSYAAMRSRPIREFPIAEAYAAAVERDTFAGYQEFLAAYPNDRLAARVRALLAARREALTWRRCVSANTPDAYWSYMQRYPRGPHFADARRRLTFLSAPLDPPPRYEAYDFGGLPPPPEEEYRVIDQPVISFAPENYPPPPPPPEYFLPPRPVEFIEIAPPPPPPSQGFLPIPIPIPVPFGRERTAPGVVIQQNFGQQGAPNIAPPAGPERAMRGPDRPVRPSSPAAVAPSAMPPQGGVPGAPARPTGGLQPGVPAAPNGAPPPAGPSRPATAVHEPAPNGALAPPNHALPAGQPLPTATGPKPGSPPGPTGRTGPPGHRMPPAAIPKISPVLPPQLSHGPAANRVPRGIQLHAPANAGFPAGRRPRPGPVGIVAPLPMPGSNRGVFPGARPATAARPANMPPPVQPHPNWGGGPRPVAIAPVVPHPGPRVSPSNFPAAPRVMPPPAHMPPQVPVKPVKKPGEKDNPRGQGQ